MLPVQDCQKALGSNSDRSARPKVPGGVSQLLSAITGPVTSTMVTLPFPVSVRHACSWLKQHLMESLCLARQLAGRDWRRPVDVGLQGSYDLGLLAVHVVEVLHLQVKNLSLSNLSDRPYVPESGAIEVRTQEAGHSFSKRALSC